MNRVVRLARYLQDRFPPALMVPSAVVNVLGLDGALQALAGRAPLQVGPRAALLSVVMLMFMLLMRIYDELKDVETDLRLGRAGDPLYKDRPLVTGAVTVDDYLLLRNVALVLLVACALPLRDPLPLAAIAASFLLVWLSSRWFFCPPISRHLLLAFATHNPLSLCFSGFVVASFAAVFGAGALGPWTVPLVVGLWAPVAAWETSRKVRTPAEETDYQTYSKVLGLGVASLVPGAFVLLSAGCLVPVARAAGLGWVYPAVVMGAAALVIGACLVLRVRPTPGRARALRPVVEVYALTVNLGLVGALALRHGVDWAR